MSNLELEIVKNAGVIGAGGAGFPTHIKLSAKVDTLIVNGAECEPLINVDKQLIEVGFEKIYKGLETAVRLTEAKEVVIAIKEKYKNAKDKMMAFKKSSSKIIDFDIFELGNFYPAGDEQVLVTEVTSKIVPEGGIPLDVGVVVINVETLLNIANAIEGINVTHKYVTVNGEVGKPSTFKVPVGTPVKDLLGQCGHSISEGFTYLDGGPMMGKVIDPDDYYVKKTTKSVLVLPDENIVIKNKSMDIRSSLKRAQAICLSCRMCTDLCPRYLLGHDLFPDEMMKKLYKGDISDEEMKNFDFAFLCCDCGLCELYSCVVDLSARSIFNYLKEEFAKRGIKNSHNRKDLKVNEFREFRKVPIPRLLQRLEIDKYDSKTPLSRFDEVSKDIRLYLLQSIGAPSEPVVKEGEEVSANKLVAKIPEGKLGSNIHSPVDGVVSEITQGYIQINKK